MPLSRRMRLAAREWLWRIQIATSRIRSRLTTAADGGRSASISARDAGSCRNVRNASQVQPGTPTAPMTTLSLTGHSRGRLRASSLDAVADPVVVRGERPETVTRP